MAEEMFFVCRLLPPRPDFVQTMTEAERDVMTMHAAHLKDWMERGKVIVYGPVGDPNGAWGLAVLKVASTEQAREIEAGDPVIKAGLGFRYEVLPMLRAVVAG